jgi:hypothetical protein
MVQRIVPLTDLKLRYFEDMQPLSSANSSDNNSCGYPVRFGIIRNSAQYHTHFVAACLEMGVPFRVIDLYRADWLQQVERASCDVLLVWPDAVLSTWNAMIKEKVQILEQVLGYPCVPSSREIWMYEDKRRMCYWLAANGVPHPQTWVFYTREEASAFADCCQVPIVSKTSFGASATGVRILRSHSDVRAAVKLAFGHGVLPGGGHKRDRQWGSILFQEYLPEVKEWRLVRIGDSFFGHPKGKVGHFHSGSGAVLWDVPQQRHLDLLYTVTELGNFSSMNVDVFETQDGRLLVNELQAVFGAGYSVDQLRVEGQPGRFVRADGSWAFEPGDFARNACANERVRNALARGLKRLCVEANSQGAGGKMEVGT